MTTSEIVDKLKRKIKITNERKAHIIVSHPEIREFENFEDVLKNPFLIKTSVYDEKVLLFYKENKTIDYKFLVLVVKVLNGEGFILTAYKTNSTKEGKVIWKS